MVITLSDYNSGCMPLNFNSNSLWSREPSSGSPMLLLLNNPLTNAAIYEDSEATGVRETAIPLSHNQAYGQVDLQERRGN